MPMSTTILSLEAALPDPAVLRVLSHLFLMRSRVPAPCSCKMPG